jgi:lysophospholipase L1-like esterase
MSIADRSAYLQALKEPLTVHWPKNRAVNVVCHGHSVPAGYFHTPVVDSINAYPHVLFALLKERYPFAVLNVIVTAIGGEHSAAGAERFEREVLCHRPDVLTLDYALNDRGLGLEKAALAWRSMIERTLARGAKVILLTPSWDNSGFADPKAQAWTALQQHAQQVRDLAGEYAVGLVDSFAIYQRHQEAGGDPAELLSQCNHPNREGHARIAQELARWFPLP